MGCLRGGIFTLIAFVSHPIISFAMINIHHFLQFDVSSFAASVQLTQKGKMQKLSMLFSVTANDKEQVS